MDHYRPVSNSHNWPEAKKCLYTYITPLHEQACISRSARGAVWEVLTCLFVAMLVRKGPKKNFACGALRIPLEISQETVFSLQCFSFGPGAVLGGAYMLVRQHACSSKGVLLLLLLLLLGCTIGVYLLKPRVCEVSEGKTYQGKT